MNNGRSRFVGLVTFESESEQMKPVLFSVYDISLYDSAGLLLGLVVFHSLVHRVVLHNQSVLVILYLLQLPTQVSNVAVEQGLDLRGVCRLAVQQIPFGLQHLILLLQQSHLCVSERAREKERKKERQG